LRGGACGIQEREAKVICAEISVKKGRFSATPTDLQTSWLTNQLEPSH
jgi:hypothetical protein